jgi:thymidylate kinase
VSAILDPAAIALERDHALRTAARIANPYGSEELARHDAVALHAAAVLLEKQQVSFIPLAGRYGAALDATPMGEFVKRDLARYRAQREEYERIRLRFVAAGVESMVFKSTGAVPAFHYLSSNLDILVPVGRAVAARRVLVELGYVELVNVEEPRKFLFRRFPGDGSSFAFHLHEVVGWGVPFLDNGPLWARARHPVDDPDILIPGPSEALLVTLAHWFYEDKALSLGNLFLTAHALRGLGQALADSAAHARLRGWEEGFWGALCVFDESWKRLFDQGFLSGEQRAELDRAPARYAAVRANVLPRVRYLENGVAAEVPFHANKVAYYRKVLRDRARSDGRKLLDVYDTLLWAVRWKLHVRSQPAVLISLSGCDGAGKTLQAERLRSVFDACDVRVKCIWARGASSRGAGAVLRAGTTVLRRSGADTGDDVPRASTTGGEAGRSLRRSEAERFNERQRKLRHPFVRWVFSLVFAADLGWAYVVRTRAAMAAGDVVICDRYICDALVDYALFTGTNPANPPLALKLLHGLVPRPHAAVLLDVDPAEALRRKPEEGGTAHLETARAMFVGLAQARRMTIMPAGAAADDIQRSLARQALGAFYERYGTVINWFLRSNPEQLNPGAR